MLTPKRSRAIRAELALSQRRAATQAGVPRSYLNQFECGRWNPTDEFLSKLTDFYMGFDGITVAEPGPERPVPAPETNAPDCVAMDSEPGTLALRAAQASTEDDDRSGAGRQTFGKSFVVVGLIGGILAATGSLPAAALVLKKLTGRG